MPSDMKIRAVELWESTLKSLDESEIKLLEEALEQAYREGYERAAIDKAQNCMTHEFKARAEERERCAKVAETYYPPVHTWASENSDRYIAQNEAMKSIARAIRGLE